MFSPAQVTVLKWISVLPGLLSTIGSFLIAQRVARSKKRRSQTYERLMLGLSVIDILNSIRLVIFPVVYHPFTKPSFPCTIDGFLISLCFAGPMYNATLSFYYLLVVVFGISNQRISKRYELWLHAIPISYGILGAFLGLGMRVFNPKRDSIACWAAEWPPRCVGDECERGRLSELYSFVVGFVPLVGILIVLVGTNTAIYMKVRSVLRKTEKYTSHPSKESQASSSANGSGLQSRADVEETHPSTRSTKQRASASKIQKVAVQSILYVLAYLLCYVWSLVVGMVALVAPDRVEKGDFFPLTVLEMLFFPAQGLFNAFVYARPTYGRLRSRDPDLSRWHCFRKALLDPAE